MSTNATFSQAAHLLTLFKNVDKEKFEAMKPFISDLCEADPSCIDRESLRKVLGLSSLAPKLFVFSLGAYHRSLSVNYNKTLREMMDSGQYDYIRDNFAVDGLGRINFPLSGSGEYYFEPRLFFSKKPITRPAVKKEMGKEGFRPANVEELLAYGAALPLEQLGNCSIYAYGSPVVIRGNVHIPWIVVESRGEPKRKFKGLHLDEPSPWSDGNGIEPYHQFYLGVRK